MPLMRAAIRPVLRAALLAIPTFVLPAAGFSAPARTSMPRVVRTEGGAWSFTLVTDCRGGGRFLPYDPRQSDEGFEIGAGNGTWFGRASFTNGGGKNPVFTGDYAEAKAVKVGYHFPAIRAGSPCTRISPTTTPSAAARAGATPA